MLWGLLLHQSPIDIVTNLDITNGARGTIVGIVLNPEEPLLGDNSIVILKHLPWCVLVKLNHEKSAHKVVSDC